MSFMERTIIRGTAASRIPVDIPAHLREIRQELRIIISGLTEYLGILPQTLEERAQVAEIISFTNVRLLFENLALVPVLVERTGFLAVRDIGNYNGVFCDTITALVDHVIQQSRRLTSLTLSLNLYALSPNRSHTEYNTMKDLCLACSREIIPNSLLLEGDQFPLWAEIMLLLANLAIKIREHFIRYYTYLETRYLRFNEVEV